MVSLTAFCKDFKELLKLEKVSKKSAAILGNEKWIMEFYSKLEELMNKVNNNSLMDIICFDIQEDNGINYAKYLRKCYEKAFMILLVQMNMSPMDYIRADIMPAGIIVQPATSQEIFKVLNNVFETYIEKMNLKRFDKAFVVATKEGRVNIPYSKILYFEARNKKIYIRYNNTEVGFYATLDKLEAELECDFVRTHRSFMVNKAYIRKINLSKNCVLLKGDETVPLSRTYKSNIKGESLC